MSLSTPATGGTCGGSSSTQGGGGKLAPQDALAVLGSVPVQISRAGAGKRQRKRGLPYLPWTGDEDHLAREVAPNLGCQVTWDQHAATLPCLTADALNNYRLDPDLFRRCPSTMRE
jgi:hypothetical protein